MADSTPPEQQAAQLQPQDGRPEQPRQEFFAITDEKLRTRQHPLYNIQSQQWENVPDENVQEALASGQYGVPDSSRIPMAFPDGQVRMVPPANFKQAASAGAVYMTTDERDIYNRRVELSGAKGAAIAAGSTALRAGTLGASDVVFGQNEDIRRNIEAAREEHPAITATADIGATIATSLIPATTFARMGKVGLALKGATAPSRASIQIAENVARRTVGKNLAVNAAKSGAVREGLRQRIARSSVENAIDSTVAETGIAVGEAFIEDKDLTASYLLSRGGMAGAIGGVGGPLINLGLAGGGAVAARAVGASADMVVKATERIIGDELSPAMKKLQEGLSKAYIKGSKLAGKNWSLDEERMFMEAVAKPKVRAGVTSPDEVITEFSERMSTRIGELEKSMKDIHSESFVEAKRAKIFSAVKKENPEAVDESVKKMLNEMRDEAQEKIRTGAANEAEFARRGDAQRIVDSIDSAINDINSRPKTLDEFNAHVFNRVEQLKREVGAVAFKRSRAGIDRGASERFFADMYEQRLMPHLEDASLYGAKAVELQQDINPAWRDYLAVKRQFERRFLEDVGDEFIPKGSRINSFLNGINSIKKDGDNIVLQRYISASKNLAESLHKGVGVGRAKSISKINDAVKELGSLSEEAATFASQRNQFKIMQKVNGSWVGNRLMNSKSLIGGVVAGAPGAVVGGALDFFQNPARVISALAVADKLAQGARSEAIVSIGRMLKNSISRAGESVLRPSRTIVPAVMRTKTETQNEKRKRIEKDLEGLQSFVNDPAAKSQEIMRGLGSLQSESPQLALAMVNKAMTAGTFLHGVASEAIRSASGIQPRFVRRGLSDQVASRYDLAKAVVEDPRKFFKRLETGAVTRTEVEALRTVHPEVYNDMRNHIAENVERLRARLDGRAERLLSIMFDVPVHPTMEHGFVALAQQSFAPPEPPPETGNATVTGLRGVSRGTKTTTQAQRLEAEAEV